MKRKSESGEVVVEASIVVTTVVIFISVFLYIGMILYQQSLVSIMANQTASNIAQVYGNSIKDPFTGYVDSDSVYQSITYGSIKNDAYVDVLNQKATTLAYYRLKTSRILSDGNPNVEVEIVKKPNELLKSQVVVTIRDQYELPLVSFFGVDNRLRFSASGRADCVDVLEYLNGVEAIGDPENSNVTYLPDSDACLVQFFDNKVDNNLLATVPVLKGKSILSSNRYTHSTMPKNPKSDKFKFTGWETENGVAFSATTQISGNTMVYGAWECTVKFEPEGGTVSPKSKKVKVWTTTSFPTPKRTGWTFLGWFTKKKGAGARYYSNATVIEDNITLYANWTCAHPSKYEYSRTGTVCEGGTINYKCTQCNADIETSHYPGNGHCFTWKCDYPHVFYSYFNGNRSGGCHGYHVPGQWCSACGITHDKVYGYCVICCYCYKTSGSYWCGNVHCPYNIYGRPDHAPANGHLQ